MDEVSHRLSARQEAHKRIIWACSWNPFGHEFATGSRDKNVKIWAVDKGSSVKQLMTLPQFSSSVTALSWYALDDQRNNGFLAVGMESGVIELWSLSLITRCKCNCSSFYKVGAIHVPCFLCAAFSMEEDDDVSGKWRRLQKNTACFLWS